MKTTKHHVLKRPPRAARVEIKPDASSDISSSEIMTLKQVGEYLLCHPSTISRIIKRRQFPAFRIGSDWRVRRSDIEKWIADRELQPKRGAGLVKLTPI